MTTRLDRFHLAILLTLVALLPTAAACNRVPDIAAATAQAQTPAAAPGASKESPPIESPFPRRDPAPSFEGGAGWLNTAAPVDLKQLRGKFVIVDFWTYCCINCMHILPELKKLEHKYSNELVVIGVHSAKFDTEKGTDNIREAILRNEIEHPVVNDSSMRIWEKFNVSSWPTLCVIDPEGYIVAYNSGEIEFATLDRFMQRALPYYQQKGLLKPSPPGFKLEREKVAATPLRFPGKIFADERGKRLFIADSNHNRIVVSNLDGKLLDVIGTGRAGRTDGNFTTAEFDHPQGMALHGDTLYVADTENHLLRKVHLATKQVTTIAGTGAQNRGPWPGMPTEGSIPPLLTPSLPTRFVGIPKATSLNSPWDVLVHGDALYIAMAGSHQIWKMPLDEKEIGPYAGNGQEDIVDGPLLPPVPRETGYSSFAQPSGLSSDGQWLYVADSEGSSIRAVPLDGKQQVRTVVGTADRPSGRLFSFGDVDGPFARAKLQHALAIVAHGGKLYVADTYNNKLKEIDPVKQTVATLAGTGKPGAADTPAMFDEPAGLAYAGGKLYVADTNNHAIRTIDLKTRHVSTLPIEGLQPPALPKTPTEFVKPTHGK